MHRPIPLLILHLVILLSSLTGCGRLRFVVDAVPSEDGLTETTVMEDKAFRFLDSRPDKVALIDVTGMIADAESSSLLGGGENPVARFSEALRRAARDRKVRAIIVRINSPGGTVTASDVMYRELKHFKESTGKPVVILMADVAASGGFYLACAGDEIIAHPTTITGSIGVIMQFINFSEGMQRIGIRAEAITSGPNKTMGSPFEPMPAEQRALFQEIVGEFYASFTAIVQEARPEVSETDLPRVTDGRIVTGAAAEEIGLVDSVGDIRDAFRSARSRAGMFRARLVKYHRPLDHVASPYSAAPAGAPEVNLVQLNLGASMLGDSTAFYYLWDPTAW